MSGHIARLCSECGRPFEAASEGVRVCDDCCLLKSRNINEQNEAEDDCLDLDPSRSDDNDPDYIEEFTPYDGEDEPYRGPIITRYYDHYGNLEGTCFQDEPGGITDCQ